MRNLQAATAEKWKSTTLAKYMSHEKTFDLHLKGLRLGIREQTEKEQLLLSSTDQQPIVHGVNIMNEKDFKQTKKKFESAYFLAKNEAPLSLFPKLTSYEERHGVIVGTSSRNRTSGREIEGKVKYEELL